MTHLAWSAAGKHKHRPTVSEMPPRLWISTPAEHTANYNIASPYCIQPIQHSYSDSLEFYPCSGICCSMGVSYIHQVWSTKTHLDLRQNNEYFVSWKPEDCHIYQKTDYFVSSHLHSSICFKLGSSNSVSMRLYIREMLWVKGKGLFFLVFGNSWQLSVQDRLTYQGHKSNHTFRGKLNGTLL